MNPSSRTPEGLPQRCPLCGKQVVMDPSTYPLLDGPCPHCGRLLSFEHPPVGSVGPYHDLTGNGRLTPVVGHTTSHTTPQEPFDRFDRRTWTGLAIVTTLIVWISGEGLLASVLWLLGVLAFGQIVVPPLFRIADRYLSEERFWLTVACAWALVSGLPVGLLFGVLAPLVEGSTVSSIEGGLLGLLLGPPFAAALGLAIAGVFNLVMWIATGKSLTQHLEAE